MRSRSSDPAYWRQKAADFRRRALGNPDDSRLVLLCRALEFDGVADELEELMHGDGPAKAPPVGGRPVRSTGRAWLAMAGAGAAFAIGCIIGVAGPRFPVGGATPSPVAFDVPPAPAATAPAPPQIVAERPPTPLADERPPESSAPPMQMTEPSAKAAAEPIESPEPVPVEKRSVPSTAPATSATPAAGAAPVAGTTDVAALESPPLPAPAETIVPPADAGRSTSAEPAETRSSPPMPASETVTTRHPLSPPPPTAAASSARPSPRSRPHRNAEPLDLRRELPPPEAPAAREPSSAESRPAPTPTRVAARTWAGYAAPTAGEAGAASQECRPYTASRTAIGLDRPVRGLACRRADGRWQLVTEIPDN